MLYATHLAINLDAIRHNLAGIRDCVGERKILVPVKANAYGHGAVEIAKLIQNEGLADWLGVATVPEALELRATGCRLPLLKLSQAFPDEIPAALDAQLTLTVGDEDSIADVGAAAAFAGVRADVHLALDTGMRRIGCLPADALRLLRLIDAEPALRLTGVFTHLPVSDTDAGVDFTQHELALFADTVASLQADRRARGLGRIELIHASNSGALLRHDLTGLTMVRPGIMVYGLYPDATTPRTIELHQALSMRTRVSFVKRIKAGETVGYGRTWTAPTDCWVATVPVGYADGFSRLNSNCGRMLIGGRAYPVAGRVCMDQTMLALGEHNPEVRVGDEVTIIGRDGDEFISTDEIAARMGTISYEVSCLIPPRVVRYYTGCELSQR